MEHSTISAPEQVVERQQVREVVQTAVEVLRERRPEQSSPSAAANSFEAEADRKSVV